MGGTPVFEDNVEDEDEDAEGCDDEEMLKVARTLQSQNFRRKIITKKQIKILKFAHTLLRTIV